MRLTTTMFAAMLICASPLAIGSTMAAPKGEPSAKNQRVQKQVRHKHERSLRHRRAVPAARVQNHPWPDPSLDRSGRPYRPNFYSPCTVDLGYGRFADCNSWND